MASGEFARKCKAFWDFLVPETWLLALVSVAFGATQATLSPVEYAVLFLAWGPLWTGATNLVNMYFDREEDAVNEPKREGVDREENVRVLGYPTILASSLVLYVATVVIVAVEFGSDAGIVALTATVVSIGYSVPPLRFKSHYLTSTSALSLCAVVLPYLSGWAIHSPLADAPVTMLGFVGVSMAHALVGKEIPDYEGDKRAGHSTFVTRFGFERGVRLFLLGYPGFYLALGVAVVAGVLPGRFVVTFVLAPVSGAVVYLLADLEKDDQTGCRRAFVATFFHGLVVAAVLYAAQLGAWGRLGVVLVGAVAFLAVNQGVQQLLGRLTPDSTPVA